MNTFYNIKELIANHNWNMPDKCPYCQAKLALNDSLTRLYCPNSKCKTYAKSRIAKFCSVAKIKELGDTTLDKMFDEGVVTDISSLFTIDYKKLGALVGPGNAKNIKAEIDKVRELSLVDFLTGYNIEDCGSKVIEKILNAKSISTWEQLDNVFGDKDSEFNQSSEIVSDFITEGIGEITASKFIDGVRSNYLDMKNTLAHGIRIKAGEKPQTGGKLTGKSFCFTGKLETMKRPEAEAKVKALGGEIKSVTRGLTYLVTNDTESGSSKNKKAKELGISIINEQEFNLML